MTLNTLTLQFAPPWMKTLKEGISYKQQPMIVIFPSLKEYSTTYLGYIFLFHLGF